MSFRSDSKCIKLSNAIFRNNLFQIFLFSLELCISLHGLDTREVDKIIIITFGMIRGLLMLMEKTFNWGYGQRMGEDTAYGNVKKSIGNNKYVTDKYGRWKIVG